MTPSSSKPSRQSYLFDTFDSKGAISNLPILSSPASSEISRSTNAFAADTEDSYVQAAGAFAKYVNVNLRSNPFPVAYTKVELSKYAIHYGAASPIAVSLQCEDATMVSAFIKAISLHQDFTGSCNGVPWVYSSSPSRSKRSHGRSLQSSAVPTDVGLICAGCTGFDYTDMCANLNRSVVIGAKIPCYVHGYIVKSSASIGIHQKPVVAKTVPEVINITVAAGRTNATADITLLGYPPGGNIYCAAVATNIRKSTVKSFSQLINVPDVVSLSFMLLNSSSILKYSLTMTGLVPVLSYDVMCALQDSLGNTGPFQSVIDSLVTVNTTCCRSIFFSNAPSSVYGDAKKYIEGNAPAATSSYVFSYYLDYVPDASVTVSPVFSFGATPVTTLKASPQSQTFMSAMTISQLKGSFILNGKAGVYSLRLVMSGPSAAMYYPLSDALQITVLSSSAPPPPPTLVNIVFSNNGAKAFVYFNSETDGAQSVPAIASATSAWPCGLLFAFKGVNNTACSWVSNAVVQVDFISTPGNSDLAVGSSVSLLGTRVKAACPVGGDCTSYAFSSASTTRANAPLNPLYPSIVLILPSVISMCDDLMVDATLSSGNGGRAWARVEWDVSSGNVFIIITETANTVSASP